MTGTSRQKKKSTNKDTRKTTNNATEHIKKIPKTLGKRRKDFLARRPHRSFILTKRRDYKRQLHLPGYWSFTLYVIRILTEHRWLFGKFIAVYALVTGLMVGVASQENFKLLSDTINELNQETVLGGVGTVTQNVAIFAGTVTGAFSEPLTEVQQLYAGLILLLGWMTVVWLLRQILAGQKGLKLRDSVYASASPLISTLLVLFVILLQLIPLTLSLAAYTVADSTGSFGDPLFTTLFWIVTVLLCVLSLYFLSSSLIALVVVTLPGMYPLRALRVAGDLVVGRRLRILYRLLWMIFILVLVWLIVLLPVIGIVTQLPSQWFIVVSVMMLLLSSFSVLWVSSYVYLLYRRIVEDDSPPA